MYFVAYVTIGLCDILEMAVLSSTGTLIAQKDQVIFSCLFCLTLIENGSKQPFYKIILLDMLRFCFNGNSLLVPYYSEHCYLYRAIWTVNYNCNS